LLWENECWTKKGKWGAVGGVATMWGARGRGERRAKKKNRNGKMAGGIGAEVKVKEKASMLRKKRSEGEGKEGMRKKGQSQINGGGT